MQRAGAEAVVTVADQGGGIPQDMLAHIFDMFTQVERTLDRAQGGLVIGLALVKRLVEMHGVAVSASSAGLGAGPDSRAQASAVAASATGTRLRVLVADDNAGAAESPAALSSTHGHEARVTDSGLSALAIGHKFRPAVVFMKTGMPGMNGHETTRRI